MHTAANDSLRHAHSGDFWANAYAVANGETIKERKSGQTLKKLEQAKKNAIRAFVLCTFLYKIQNTHRFFE